MVDLLRMGEFLKAIVMTDAIFLKLIRSIGQYKDADHSRDW